MPHTNPSQPPRLRNDVLLIYAQTPERLGVSISTIRSDFARLRTSTKARRQPAETQR